MKIKKFEIGNFHSKLYENEKIRDRKFPIFLISTENIFFVFDINKILDIFYENFENFYEKSFFTREEHAEHKIRSIYRPPSAGFFFLWFMIPITRDW